MLRLKSWITAGFFCIFLSNNSSAQVTDYQLDYQPLTSTGTLPPSVTTSSSKKYRKQLSRIQKNEKKSDKKLKKNFFLQSNFIIDDLLQSGYILYNDPLGEYVNKVADVVLKDKPTLRKKLQFYVMRSSAVNAFTTDQGIIFISMGLLSQLENEAQLAFILCHEIVHYQKEHGIDLLLEVDKINNETSQKYVLNKTTFNKDLFRFSFSRELETEADVEGFDLYKQTNYDLHSLSGVFNVLAYSYLPFDDKPFEKSFFERDYLNFPTDYQLETIKPISEMTMEDDSESTHPDMVKRKLKIRNLVSDYSNDNRAVYLVSKTQFEQVRQTARFEVPLLSLNEQEFYRAIFESYLLLQEYPENFYLKKCMAKGLYLSAKYRNSGFSYEKSVADFEGEIQGIVHFMKKFSDKKLNIFAASYLWELYAERPKDKEVAIMAKDLLIELNYAYDMTINDFKKWSTPSQEVLSAEKTLANQSTKLSKSEKIKLTELKNSQNNKFWQTAFSPILENNHFVKIWQEAKEEGKERQDWKVHSTTYEGKEDFEKYLKKKSKNGVRLGIDKIVVINPAYLKLDTRKDNAVLYEKGEKSQIDFHQIVKENVKMAGLKSEILDVESIRPNDVEKFNDITILTEWFSNQGDYNDLYATPSLRQNEVAALVKKYGTKFFCWTGVVSLREKKSTLPYWGILVPYAWPWVAKYALKNPTECLYYNIVFNVETGQREVVKFQYLDTADSKSLLNMQVYDAFLQIKSK